MKLLSEIEIIKRLRTHPAIGGIGDDAAEFNISAGFTPIVTIDSFTEKHHFDTRYFTPYNIGYKSMAGSISDIAGSGGLPKYALVSVGLKEGSIEFIEKFYNGINEVAKLFNIEVIGGDTVKSECISVTICVIGEAKRVIKRTGAQIGDKICVTGRPGSSYAGLLCLQNGLRSSLTKTHLNPLPRVEEGIEIAKYANSMIDISDGLSTDLFHILEESKVCARIWRNKLPVSEEVKKVAEKFSLSPEAFALNGGEDFELLFTIPEKYVEKIRKTVMFTEIGEIIRCRGAEVQGSRGAGEQRCRITDENGNEIPAGGFDHFGVNNG